MESSVEQVQKVIVNELYLQKPLAIPNSRNASTEESRHPNEVGQRRGRVVRIKYRAASPINEDRWIAAYCIKAELEKPKPEMRKNENK